MTRWSQYAAYCCRVRSCQADCINHVDAEVTQAKVCRSCAPFLDLDELDPITDHLPSSIPTSDGETRRVAAGASAPSAGSAESAGSGGLPPDPEAIAQSPNPEGEGGPEREARAASERSR